MDLIKGLLADSLNGFSPAFIPFFLLQLLCAGFFALMASKMYKRKFKLEGNWNAALYGVLIALAVALSKNSLPVAVIAAAIVLLMFKVKDLERTDVFAYGFIAVIGLGCGMGSIVQTFIGLIIFILVLLFLPLKSEA